MPDLSNYKIDTNGNIWCFDKADGSLYLIKYEVPLIAEVPPEVIYSFLLDKYKNEGNKNGK